MVVTDQAVHDADAGRFAVDDDVVDIESGQGDRGVDETEAPFRILRGHGAALENIEADAVKGQKQGRGDEEGRDNGDSRQARVQEATSVHISSAERLEEVSLPSR